MRQAPIDISLHERQSLALQSSATEILYGGAAGGGKSHLMRCAAIIWCAEIPGLQVYLFRRIYDDLKKNHMEGPSGFPVLLAEWANAGLVSIVDKEIRFWNGSKIYLCHCEHEKHVYKYQGAEIHVLLIDELTHFTEKMYRFLRGRMRLGGLVVPDKYKGVFPRAICGSNPGNIGHQWVKASFVDYQPAQQIKQTERTEGGLLRQYIPAKLEDNPTLLENDPDYEMRLEALGSPELVRAMRDGDWDIVAGAAFEKLTRDKHLIRPFKPPAHWTKFMALDWGTAKPFSVGWYCVVEGMTRLAGKDGYGDVYLPDGAVVRYREWYGWNGKPDEGCRKESVEVAKRCLEIEREANESIDYRVGDAAMWAQSDGPSPQERMYTATDGIFNLRQSKKDRISGYQEVRLRIAGEESDNKTSVPMFYITANCTHFWRTVPTLQLDMLTPEKGPDTDMEDHVYDEVAYALMSRPYVTNRLDRTRVMLDEARAKIRQNKDENRDPYSHKSTRRRK